MRNNWSPVGSYPSTDLNMDPQQTSQENLVNPNCIIIIRSLHHFEDHWWDAFALQDGVQINDVLIWGGNIYQLDSYLFLSKNQGFHKTASLYSLQPPEAQI